jgi:hypothetical protein
VCCTLNWWWPITGRNMLKYKGFATFLLVVLFPSRWRFKLDKNNLKQPTTQPTGFVFWHIIPCHWGKGYRCFQGKYSLFLQMSRLTWILSYTAVRNTIPAFQEVCLPYPYKREHNYGRLSAVCSGMLNVYYSGRAADTVQSHPLHLGARIFNYRN